VFYFRRNKAEISFLEHCGLSMTQQDFQPGFKLGLHHKDLKICQSMAAKNAARVPLVEQTLLDYEKLIKEGFADEDISALFRLKYIVPPRVIIRFV
jgi:3-hydroxyisobutyrate dehydrogenase